MQFLNIFFSSKEVTKYRNISLLWIIPILLLSMFFLTAHYMVARTNLSSNLVSKTFEIHESFNEIYDLNVDCKIIDSKTCLKTYNNKVFSGYELVVDGEPTTDKYMQFSNTITIQYDKTLMIRGSYSELQNVSWQLPDEYDANQYTDLTIGKILDSTLVNDLVLNNIFQFVELIIYAGLVSLILLIINFRRPQKIITYKQSLNIAALILLGTSLVAGIVGFFFNTYVAIVFMVTYALRIMFVYSHLNSLDNSQ